MKLKSKKSIFFQLLTLLLKLPSFTWGVLGKKPSYIAHYSREGFV